MCGVCAARVHARRGSHCLHVKTCWWLSLLQGSCCHDVARAQRDRVSGMANSFVAWREQRVILPLDVVFLFESVAIFVVICLHPLHCTLLLCSARARSVLSTLFGSMPCVFSSCSHWGYWLLHLQSGGGGCGVDWGPSPTDDAATVFWAEVAPQRYSSKRQWARACLRAAPSQHSRGYHKHAQEEHKNRFPIPLSLWC